MEIVLLLAIPLAGAVLLALFGARRWAPEVNVLVSLATFVAACALTARVISDRQLHRGRRAVLHRSVQRIPGGAHRFVGLTTSLFSRPYMRIEREHGRVGPAQLRLYHSMYQLFIAAMLIALTTNNMGLMWVAMEAATLSTVLLVTLYRTPASLEAGWKYFILCGVGIAQALFGTILLYFAAEKIAGRRGHERAALDAPQCGQGPARADRAEPRVRVPAGRLRHQGRPRAAAQLAAGRARGRSDADLRRAFRAAAQRRDLRRRALQGAGRRLAALAAAFADADGLRPRLGGARRVLPLAAARHQAAVRLLVDRAHGHHHVRLRHGRARGELRRAAAHDRALADQVRDLLRRRARRAEGRHAGHGRHPRPDHAQSRRSAGA